MGSCWESDIARLIDQANETLSSSAYFRYHGVRTSLPKHRGHHTSTRSSSRTHSAVPSTFRGDRGASYRRGSEGWGASLLTRERAGDGVGSIGDGFRICPLAPAPASYSRLAAARVDTARMDGMEDRIKLEVQTWVRRDVNQRLTLPGQAVEAVGRRVEGLAEEVAILGETVCKSNASTATALEQLIAGEQRSRRAVTALETWREDRKEWCARTGDSLTSLTEDAKALKRRTHTLQKVLDEAVTTQEDLAASVRSSRKIGEVASASAIAPVREHFLKEIETIRRRVLALEDEAQRGTTVVVPAVTRSQVKSIAEGEASAKAEEVWRKIKPYVQEQAKDTADVAVTARKRLDLRLAEVEQRVSAQDSALEVLQKAGRDTLIRGDKALSVRDAMQGLEKRLVDGLTRLDDELCEVRSGESRHTVAEAAAHGQPQAVKPTSGELAARNDLKPILRRLEELEHSRDLQSSAEVAPTTVAVPSSPSVEKVESIARTVQELASGAEVTLMRQGSFENSLEEVSETLNGHTLKLRSFEGLWREALGRDNKRNATPRAAKGDSSNRSSNTSGAVFSEATLDVSIAGAAKGYPSVPTVPALRAGLGGLLKRLGSSPVSSIQKEIGMKETGGGGDGGRGTLRTSVGKIKELEKPVPQSEQSEPNTGFGVEFIVGGIEVQPHGSEPTAVSGDGNKRLTELVEDNGQGSPSSSSGHGTTLLDENDSERVGGIAALPGIEPDQALGASSQQQQQQQSPGREGGSRRVVLQSEAPADENPEMSEPSAPAILAAPPAVETTQTTKPAVEKRAAKSRENVAAAEDRSARELEESSGSLEGDSAHSRWSLPDSRGFGGFGAAGNLREQRAVWPGGQDDDSVGTVEQAPSSVEGEEGGRQEDGKYPSRSRVESYDLQQESGNDYMVPFSPARSSAASPNGSPNPPPNSGAPADADVASEQEDTPVVAVAGGIGEASTTAETPAPTRTTGLTPDLSPTGAAGSGGGGGVLLDGVPSTKGFIFLDDDESEEDKLDGPGRRTTRPKGSDQHDDTTRLNSGGGRSTDKGEAEKEHTGSGAIAIAEESDTAATAQDKDSGGSKDEERKQNGRRGRRRHSKSSNSNNDESYGHSSSSGGEDDNEKSECDAERTFRRSRRKGLLNPLGSPQGVHLNGDGGDDGNDGRSLTPPPRGKREVANSACATPAPGAWAAPDFGFSSDDDLDMELSASGELLEEHVDRSSSSSPTIGTDGAEKN